MRDVVVLGVADGATAGRIAQHFGHLGLRTLLAFEHGQVARSLDHRTCLVLLDPHFGRAGDAHMAVARANDIPLMVIASHDPAEVVLQAAGLLRRHLLLAPSRHAGELRAGDLLLDRAAHEVRWCGRVLPTTPYQRRLLEALLAAEGAVVSDGELARAMYGTSLGDDGARVRAHVKRLRKAFAAIAPRRDAPIERVRGAGYRLVGRGGAQGTPT